MDDLQKSCKRPHLTKEERLPRCYKDTEKIIKSAKSCKSNLKTALANSRLRGTNFKKVYNLSLNVLKQYDYIQKIIEEIKLLENEKFFRRELASILIYEILFGYGYLAGKSKPEHTMNKYRDDIMNAHQNLQYCYIGPIPGFTIPRYVRVHTLVTTADYVIKDLENLGFKRITYNESITEEEYMNLLKKISKGYFIVDFHFKDILAFAHDENLHHLKLYNDGHIFLQDKSSYIPVHVLNPEPGSIVLDACAAPGMKTLHIASKMKNKGTLIACEKDQTRFKTLQEMIQRGAVKISKLHCTDFRLIDPYDPAYSSLNYILLDPSCSGSGMVNRMDEVTDTEDSKNKDRLLKLAGFQIVLLKHALKFPSVKRVVYSTCSVNEEENEYVVHEALSAFNRSFRLVSAMPDWTERGKDHFQYGKLCLRAVTEKHLTNGFFVAVFERLNDEDKQNFYGRGKILKNNTACDGRDERNNEGDHKFSSKKRKRENSRSNELNENERYYNSLKDTQNICEEKQDCRDNSQESENTVKHKKKKKHKHNEIKQEIIVDAEPKKKNNKHKHDETEQEEFLEVQSGKTKDKNEQSCNEVKEEETEIISGKKRKDKKVKHRHNEGEGAFVEILPGLEKSENNNNNEYNKVRKQELEILPRKKKKDKKRSYENIGVNQEVNGFLSEKKDKATTYECDEVKEEIVGVVSKKMKKHKPNYACDEAKQEEIDSCHRKGKYKTTKYECDDIEQEVVEASSKKGKHDKITKSGCNVVMQEEFVDIAIENKKKHRKHKHKYNEANQGEPISYAPSMSKEYKTELSVQNGLQLDETNAELFTNEHEKHKHKKHKKHKVDID